MSRIIWSSMSALLLGACATQPEYRSPAASLPPEWTNATDRLSATHSEDARHELWWSALADPAIDTLVLAALSDNPTLAAALARVDEAKAIVASQRAQRSPRIDVTAS